MEIMSAQHPITPNKPGFRPKLRYRKEGKGSLYLFNAIIKPGQVVSCYPEDIPASYKDVLICIDSIEMQEWAAKENKASLEQESLYELVERETHGWYDLINKETGKSINEKRLRKADAEALLDSLNS